MLRLTPISASNTAGLALLASLHQAIFAGSGERLWQQQDFQDIATMPQTFLAVAEGSEQAGPMGFIALSIVGGDSPYQGEAEIITIGVVPDQRGKGIGAVMLAAVLDMPAVKSANLGSVMLEVREGNQAARAFYHRCGFEITGRRRGYYQLEDGSNQDALVMVLRLAGK